MKIFRNICFLLLILNASAKISANANNKKDKYEKLRITKKNHLYIKNLHLNWYGLAVKALMGQLGKKLYKQLLPAERLQLARCLDNVDEKHDLVLAARCLIDAKNRQISKQQKQHFFHLNIRKLPKIRYSESQKWIGSFNVIKTKKISNVYSRNGYRSYRFQKYRMRRRRIKRSPYRLVENDYMSDDDKIDRFKVKNVENIGKLVSRSDVSPITKFSNFLRSVLTLNTKKPRKNDLDTPKWPLTYESLSKLKNEIDRKKRLPGSKPYEFRMYDLVLENEEPTWSPKERHGPIGMFSNGLNMISSFMGSQNLKKRRKSNSRWLSPRFMPLTPEKIDSDSEIFSPSVLSFYKDNKTIASLPDIFNSFGVSTQDRDSILSMLMDLTGTTKHVDNGLDILKELNFFEVKNEILEANEKIVSNFFDLENSLDVKQKNHLNENGYTYMDNYQIEKFYKGQQVHILNRFKRYSNFSLENFENSLWKTVEGIAKNTTIPQKKRQKRFFIPFDVEEARESGNVDLFKPIILSPYAFAPTFGLAILGPIILSPSIFSPELMNPSILSPIIMSPVLGEPEIMSPYILGPFILSPQFMLPGIFTPYALSPNIINPFVMSPLILSPIMLSPDILSPQILGGGVLSPAFGSPSVFTETALMLSVLSPSFLS